jgi:hypothetical protein
MKAPITQAIDTLVAQHLAPALKEAGFRKKGQRFWRSAGPLIHVVEIERWKYNEGSQGKFQISVGVYSDEVWQLHEKLRPGWGEGYNPSPPPIQNCLFDDVVLAPAATDTYWPVDATDSIDHVAMASVAETKAAGLSWLDRHQSLRDCVPRLAELSGKNSWMHSVNLFCIGAILKDQLICGEQILRVLENPNRKAFSESQRQAFRDLNRCVFLEAHAS